MNEKFTKVILTTINVLSLMAGTAMLAGGLLLEYTTSGRYILQTLNTNITSTQLGAIGVVLIAVGAFIMLVSIVGFCGTISESRGLLGLYFIFILILFLCVMGVVIAAFVFGKEKFYKQINTQLQIYVRGYRKSSTEAAIVDTVQQFFDCCGYDGPSDYNGRARPVSTTQATQAANASMTNATAAPASPTTAAANATTATMLPVINITGPVYFDGYWPASCCKKGADVNICQNNTLPESVLKNYLNTQGCTMSIDAWVQQNFIIIGAVTAGIAFIELLSMILACCLRSKLD